MKLHLGCGKRNIPGFINVDLARFPHIHYRRSVDDLSMIPSGSVELIYTSHAFGYFDREEARAVLKEWRRVLKRGGVLRIAVSDFEKLVRIYKKYGQLKKIIGPLFGRWPIRGNEEYIYQKTIYDFKDLKKLLNECGFTSVHRYDWRKTIHKDYDDHSQAYIPHMQKDTGILISLNVEATKK